MVTPMLTTTQGMILREKTCITAIGSCRISTPFKRADTLFPVLNNTARVYGYTHTSAEALQQIKFLQGDFTPLSDVMPLLMPNTDLTTLTDTPHASSDIYFIELSSAKTLSLAGMQVQLNYVAQHFADFFSNKRRTRDFWRLADGTQEIAKFTFLNEQPSFHALSDTDKALLNELLIQPATPQSLKADITEIQNRVPRAVFITHCNANAKNGLPIASRANHITMIETAVRATRGNLFNPTASMQAFGQGDALSDPETSLSHYSTDFGDFLFAGLFDHFIAPLQGVGTMPTATALAKAISLYKNRNPVKSISPEVGSIAMITGSLGAGGAERQLTRLAVEMKTRQALAGMVEVIVSTLSPDRGRDFFLPQLQAAKIPVSVINSLPARSGQTTLPIALQDLHRHLPPQTQEALQRLTPHFQTHRPEVAYIWQDGAVLATALAALAADVPRIVISLRGMPPNLRPEMMKDEYFEMYRALSQTPGVTFSANTHASAKAYAAWLDLPGNSIKVVHNAANPLLEEGDKTDIAKWETFVAETPDADFTFGAIFRFDQNKRPLLWLEFAAAALVAHPASRFVLVGDGLELQAAKTYARDMGFSHRCLFVGKSRNVGYWLSRMNALGLTSRLEGLPNVLIEAQLAGLPVISTPAGGASETFIHGQSGFLLDSTQTPRLEQFLGYYLELANNSERRASMATAAKTFAMETFAIDKILPETLQLLSDTLPERRRQKQAVRA